MEVKSTQNGRDQLTPAQAARIVGVHPQTMRDWERLGRISSRRTPGGHRRYLRADVEALLNTEGPKPAAPNKVSA